MVETASWLRGVGIAAPACSRDSAAPSGHRVAVLVRIVPELVLTPCISQLGSAAALIHPLLFDLPAAACCCHGDGALVLPGALSANLLGACSD